MKRDESLFQFFAGYFHQDWMLDDSTWQDVVLRFRREEGPKAAQVAERISSELLTSPLSEDDLSDLVWKEYGAEYRPQGEGLTMREWLTGVQQILTR